MSLMSMTGYGQGESSNESYQLSVEIKSVNHRFRDLRFKMSSVFNPLEMDARKKIENNFARGSFDIFVHYKKSLAKNQSQTADLVSNLDEHKVKAFIERAQLLSPSGSLNVDASLFLRTEFLKTDDNKEQELQELFQPALDQALENLKIKRNQEGAHTQKAFLAIIKQYSQLFESVVSLKEKFQPVLREKLQKRVSEAKANLEELEPRLLQEIIFYMEKWDVDEEIVRINAHLESMQKLIMDKKLNIAGRKIEFLLQELGRETNTIGSKSHMQEISQVVVDMKVQLEKMREQAANVQ